MVTVNLSPEALALRKEADNIREAYNELGDALRQADEKGINLSAYVLEMATRKRRSAREMIAKIEAQITNGVEI